MKASPSSRCLSSLLRLAMTRAILIALFCTCFSLFNIPVFWPILVLYFIILFVITMKRQILVRCWAGYKIPHRPNSV